MTAPLLKPIITSGTVAANLLRFSNATGAYFVDTDDATLAAALAAAATHHDIIEIFDSSKRMLRFAVKSVGTGETLGSEILDVWTNVASQPFETFSTSGSDITQAVNTTGYGIAIKVLPSPVGKLYKIVNTSYTLNSGGDPTFTLSDAGYNVLGTNIPNGSMSYRTAIPTTYALQIYVGSGVATDFSFTGTSIKQVTTPSTNGCLVQKYPGGADGFSVVAASFNYNNTSGYSWRVVSAIRNGQTVYDQTVTAGQTHCSMVDGTAFIFHDSIDLAAYQVGPSGKYLIACYDSSNRMAYGYGKAVGAGLSYDSEINTGTLTANKLYEITATEVNHFGIGLIVGSSFTSGGTETCDANNKVKQVLTPSATGLTITSTPDGETYNWASIATGFDANAITKIKIWRHT